MVDKGRHLQNGVGGDGVVEVVVGVSARARCSFGIVFVLAFGLTVDLTVVMMTSVMMTSVMMTIGQTFGETRRYRLNGFQ